VRGRYLGTWLRGFSEFESIVGEWDKLKALRVIMENGMVDYGLILRIHAATSKDEYLKNTIFGFAVENFREDLREMLDISFDKIRIE